MSGVPFIRMYANDWFTGCVGLKADERGVYISMCVYIWTAGRRVPLDDAEAARMMCLQFNNYQRLRDALVRKGKVQTHDDGYGVKRAEKELDHARNRAEAGATARDGRRVNETAEGIHAEGEGRVDQVRPQAGEGAAPGRAVLGAKAGPPVSAQAGASAGEAQKIKQNQQAPNDLILKTNDSEEKKKENYDRPQSVTANGPNEIVGLNGSTAEIVEGVAKLLNGMAPDYVSAKRMISSNVSIYGAHAVRDGYAELMADIADNKVRVPSYKALLGYFKTASERPIGHAKQRQMSDYSSQRIERGREFLDLLNEGVAA